MTKGPRGSYGGYVKWLDAKLQRQSQRGVAFASLLSRSTPAQDALRRLREAPDFASATGGVQPPAEGGAGDGNNDVSSEVDHVAVVFPADVHVRLCCTLWARGSLSVLHHLDGAGMSAEGPGVDVDA